MPVRNRNGKLEWRFKVNGHEYSKITELPDTARNRTVVQRQEADARRLILEGRASELQLHVEPFSSAVEAFSAWAKGEYAAHPSTWTRLKGSFTSASKFFGRRPLASVRAGDIEDYKAHRRSVNEVREITLRHDLHALSLLFQYGKKHNWCHVNPIREIEIPSDKYATRENVLSPQDELRYFAAIDALIAEKTGQKRTMIVRGLQDVRDLSVLMLNQGCRPEELRSLRQEDVDLEHATMTIRQGKSPAARRVLATTAASRDVLSRRLQKPGTWVFPSQRYGSRHMGSGQRTLVAILKKCEIPMVLYDLRHTFATRAVERGVELPKLMAILGHANLRSIMRYVHMKQEHINEGMRQFEERGLVEEAERKRREAEERPGLVN